jgi:hypothetical protein
MLGMLKKNLVAVEILVAKRTRTCLVKMFEN